MRNLSFFKLPYRRNFICLRKDSPLIPYGYLESHHLNSILGPLPLSTPIKGFLNSDFTQDEPFKQKQLFKQYIEQQIKVINAIGKTMKTDDLDVVETMNVIVQRNILNPEIWVELLRIIANSRLRELESGTAFGDLMLMYRRYTEKFMNKSLLHRYKFNISEQVLKGYDFESIFTRMYEIKGPVHNLRHETYTFSFIKDLSYKISFNLAMTKKYYQSQLSNVKQLLEKEESIATILSSYYIYHMLGIQTPEITEIFEQKLQKLYENRPPENYDFSMHQSMNISSMWLTTGRYNPKLKINNIERISKMFLSINKSIHFLYSLIATNQETPELVHKILSTVHLPDININLKVDLHKCLHLLCIRGYDLSKYERLINRLSSICIPSHSQIMSLVDNSITIKSPCFKNAHVVTCGNIGQFAYDPETSELIKRIQSIFNSSEMEFIKNFRFCRFLIDRMLIRNKRMIAVQFSPSKNSLIKPVGETKMKNQMLQYYRLKVAQIDSNCPELQSVLQSKDPEELYRYIQALTRRKALAVQ